MAFKGKKASLELSIRAIVIVVLAMTLLGLGLSFIKGMFGDITSISDITFDKISDQLQRDLINSDEKLVFSQTKINAERGKDYLLGWGVKNENSETLEYWAEFKAVNCPDDCDLILSNTKLNKNWFSFKYNFKYDEDLRVYYQEEDLFYKLDVADQHVKRVELNMPRDATPGKYLIELSIYGKLPEGGNIANARNFLYASTDIFITVK